MSEQSIPFVALRSETLAKEFLTRLPDVDLHTFEKDQIDFIATLRPDPEFPTPGFMPFAAIVWGTDRGLSSEVAASRFANRKWSRERQKGYRKFFMPVIALIFSASDDAGYFAWVAKPLQESGSKLHLIDDLECSKIGRGSLGDIVAEVRGWYELLAPEMLAIH